MSRYEPIFKNVLIFQKKGRCWPKLGLMGNSWSHEVCWYVFLKHHGYRLYVYGGHYRSKRDYKARKPVFAIRPISVLDASNLILHRSDCNLIWKEQQRTINLLWVFASRHWKMAQTAGLLKSFKMCYKTRLILIFWLKYGHFGIIPFWKISNYSVIFYICKKKCFR